MMMIFWRNYNVLWFSESFQRKKLYQPKVERENNMMIGKERGDHGDDKECQL